MIFHYVNPWQTLLVDLLERNKDALNSLTYLINSKFYDNLKILPKENSIEIYNNEISISILLFVNFIDVEYDEVRQKKNYHLIIFNSFTNRMSYKKFEKEVQYISSDAWFYYTLEFNKSCFCEDLKFIKDVYKI